MVNIRRLHIFVTQLVIPNIHNIPNSSIRNKVEHVHNVTQCSGVAWVSGIIPGRQNIRPIDTAFGLGNAIRKSWKGDKTVSQPFKAKSAIRPSGDGRLAGPPVHRGEYKARIVLICAPHVVKTRLGVFGLPIPPYFVEERVM
jgi:hypothetical protein